MDIHHALWRNPLRSPYGELPWRDRSPVAGTGWIDHDGGIVEIGHAGDGFAFDNEGPRHDVLLRPFRIASSPVTCGDWLTFMADGGYRRADLWMSDGWSTVQAQGWEAPLYWERRGDDWEAFGLDGLQPVDAAAPVVHVSWYEADAFARWAGARLPSEAEWETVAPAPGDPDDGGGWYGAVWQWTASPYVSVPRVPASGRRGRRVQRQVHGQPARAARQLPGDAAGPRPADLPQLLPATRPLGLQRRSAGLGLTRPIPKRIAVCYRQVEMPRIVSAPHPCSD